MYLYDLTIIKGVKMTRTLCRQNNAQRQYLHFVFLIKDVFLQSALFHISQGSIN